MKRNLLIIISALVTLLSACSRFEYSKCLTDADSLISTNPQRAIAMLDSIAADMTTASKHDRMYHSLLRIKAADKAYIKQTSDSTILTLISYYENDGDEHLLPEAYYYAGRIYANMNDAPRALEYYQKAQSILPEKEMELRGILHFQIACLLLNQALYPQAIESYKKAYNHYLNKNEEINIIHTLRDMAYTYDKMGKTDNSLACYQKAYQYAKKIDNPRMKISVLSQIAAFYIKKKDYAKAWKYLQPSINEHDSINISPDYTMALKIYMNMGQYDSAYSYGMKLMDIGNIYAKQTASRHLLKLALIKNERANALKYMDTFFEYTDSVNKITATEAVNRINSLYNYNLREKENETLKAENSKKTLIIIAAIAFILISAMLFLVYNAQHKMKQKQQTERLKNMRKRLYERSEEYIQNN